jgi:hypothetical protein
MRLMGLDVRHDMHFAPTTDELISAMQTILSISPDYLADYMDPLEMRDCEHSLCEFDKYMRVKLGEGRPRQKFVQPQLRNQQRLLQELSFERPK